MVDMPTDSQGGTERDRMAGVRAILTLLYEDGFADIFNHATRSTVSGLSEMKMEKLV